MARITDLYVTMECQVDTDSLYQRAEELKADIDEMSEEELAGFVHDWAWQESGRLLIDLWGVEVADICREEDEE
jgi:hypothetical protein